jgi:TonB family protein
MRDDDDDALAGIDLAAWQPPEPPTGTADAVIARMREPAAVPAAMPVVDPTDRPSRRAWWIGGLTLAAAAVVAIAAWGVTRAPRNGHGDVVATRAGHLELDGSTAELDAGAQVRWDRVRHRITAHQARGSVRWTVADDDTLMIDSGGSPSAVTIEASGASLRVEVQMNISDVRLMGATTLTSAAVAVMTVVVYAGHVKATSGGQTVNVSPGATLELRPDRPPQVPAEPPPRPTEPIAVGATPIDVRALEGKLRAADERIAKLTAELAAREAEDTANALTVAPSALEGSRLEGGDKNIVPDADTKRAIAAAGSPKLVGTFKLCINRSGAVSSVKVLKPTGSEGYDQTILQRMHTWKYRPFEVDGKPAPVCTAITFIYTQN